MRLSERSASRGTAAEAGLVLVGEPLAVDLANTLKVVTGEELLVDDDRHAAFWALQADRLPAGADVPDSADTLALRAAVRSVLTSHLDGRPPDPGAIRIANSYAAAAATAPQLAVDGDSAVLATAWSTGGAALALGAAARSAIDVVTGAASDRLRVCASSACSMLFVATNAKRRWCSAAACGNRERVARHARLVHQRRMPA